MNSHASSGWTHHLDRRKASRSSRHAVMSFRLAPLTKQKDIRNDIRVQNRFGDRRGVLPGDIRPAHRAPHVGQRGDMLLADLGLSGDVTMDCSVARLECLEILAYE